MPRPASSRTVATSTGSPAPPTDAPHSAVGRAAARAAAPFTATGHAASARVSRFWTTPGWRRVKASADKVLLFAVLGAVGWAATNGVFVAQRAVANRAVALVNLASQPAVQIVRAGGGGANATLPSAILQGTRTERISIGIANDGPDGVVLKDGTLSGPYLVGDARLAPDASGYIAPTGSVHLIGTVTVDCDAAARVAGALVAGVTSPEQQATTVAISVTDPNGNVRRSTLVVDTTAFAVQGQVCTS